MPLWGSGCCHLLRLLISWGEGEGGGHESKGKSLKITINILSCLNGKKKLRALSESSSVSAKGSQCL